MLTISRKISPTYQIDYQPLECHFELFKYFLNGAQFMNARESNGMQFLVRQVRHFSLLLTVCLIYLRGNDNNRYNEIVNRNDKINHFLYTVIDMTEIFQVG